MSEYEYRQPTPQEYDDLLVQTINETSMPDQAPSLEERKDLAERLGYASNQELAAVCGLAPSSLEFFEEGRNCGLFEPTLRKLVKVAAAVAPRQ